MSGAESATRNSVAEEQGCICFDCQEEHGCEGCPACEQISSEFRNRALPPITDPLYADSMALQAHITSYDYIVSQPSVLDEKTAARMLEIMAEGRRPLAADPLPLDLTNERKGQHE